MCTNFVLIKKNGVAALAERLAVNGDLFVFGDNMKPGSPISIIFSQKGERQVRTATWWLYLKQSETGLKPDARYFSVNTNHAKLGKKPEYRKSRCIIPATAFVESQDGKRPHLLEPADGSAIAFGGLYKQWKDRVSGEVVWSASIITLPGHKALENIHRKSTPLWLPDDAFDDWLDDGIVETGCFERLLVPALRTQLVATPVDKVVSKNSVGGNFLVE